MLDSMTNQPKCTRRQFTLGALATGVAATLVGCGQQNSQAQASKNDTLNYYIPNPMDIDPYNQNDEGTRVGEHLFDSLTRYDFKQQKLVSLAAKSWDVSQDGKTFTFHLHEGMKFHNGEVCDAQSFKRGWERIVNPKTQGSPSTVSYHLSLVDGYDDVLNQRTEDLRGLECPDKTTFIVHLTAPYADFPFVCTHAALAPVPQAALDNPKDFFVAPIGNGPYQMDGKWVDDQYINIKRFDDYYAEKATIEKVHFNIQKDPETAYREFEAGNIDYTLVPTTRYKEVCDKYGTADDTIQPKHQVLTEDLLRLVALNVNMDNQKLQDVDLRRALSLAINRQDICDHIMQGAATPATDVVPQGIKGHKDGAWQWCSYDLDKANQLLDAKYPRNAEGKRDITLTIEFDTSGSMKDIIAQVASDWEKLGIGVITTVKELAAIHEDYKTRNFEFARGGWTADYPIMDNFIYPLFYTGNSDNHSHFSNAALDAEIDQARQTLDEQKRLEMFEQIDAKIGDEVPMIPLFFNKAAILGSDKIKELYVSPTKNAFVQEGKLA